MTAVEQATTKHGEGPVSMPEVMTAVGKLQAAAEALAAVGARAAVSEPGAIHPDVSDGIDEVLAAAGIPSLDGLEPPQRMMVAAYVRSAFGQAMKLLAEPTRPPGWAYDEPAVLEGQGRASMGIPGMLAQTGEIGGVTSLLDVGTGVGWLAVAALQVWPGCSVVGIDTWDASLARARANVAESGLADRIEIRDQDVADVDDVDRFDLTWLPSFFVRPDVLPAAFERTLAATKPGGQIVVARYDAPPDPLASATLKLRTVRDGGSFLETDELLALLEKAGWTDVRIAPKNGPITLTFVLGRKG